MIVQSIGLVVNLPARGVDSYYMTSPLIGRGQGFDFRFWRALDADWWENEPVKTGLDGLDVAGCVLGLYILYIDPRE